MNQILFELGPIQIYWYSLVLLIAFVLGGFLAFKEAKKHNISETFMIDLCFYLVPIAIIGARLYYVAFNWQYYSVNLLEIFKIWEGGLAIHGGIISSLIFLSIYTHKKNVNFWRMTDILVVSLILGQAIGRWGNFFNGEAHGGITTLQTLQNFHLPNFIINGMYINGQYYIPTFLYESIWNLFGFITIILCRRFSKIKIGQITSFYLIWYGIGRLLIEGMRTDSLMFGSFRVAQLVSLVMIVIGIILFLIKRYEKLYRKEEII